MYLSIILTNLKCPLILFVSHNKVIFFKATLINENVDYSSFLVWNSNSQTCLFSQYEDWLLPYIFTQ